MSMNYQITADEQERFHIEFSDDVVNVVGLRMAPDALEPELQNGQWLILAFAVWDAKDRPAIEVACRIAASLEATRVAVRPFELPDEFATWAPELADHEITVAVSESRSEVGTEVSIVTMSDDHPMWLLFRGGQMVRASIGIRTFEEVTNFISAPLG